MVPNLSCPEVPRPQLDRATALGIALFINLSVLGSLTLPRDLALPPPPLPAIDEPLIVEAITRAEPEVIEPVPKFPDAPPRPQPPRPVERTPQQTVPPVVSTATITPMSTAPVEPSTPVQSAYVAPSTPVNEIATIRYRDAPAPRYPRVSIRRHEEGVVVLRILVGRDGRPEQVLIERSSGHGLLDQAAREQVQQRWRFIPAERAGQTIAAWARVPVEFKLPR